MFDIVCPFLRTRWRTCWIACSIALLCAGCPAPRDARGHVDAEVDAKPTSARGVRYVEGAHYRGYVEYYDGKYLTNADIAEAEAVVRASLEKAVLVPDSGYPARIFTGLDTAWRRYEPVFRTELGSQAMILGIRIDIYYCADGPRLSSLPLEIEVISNGGGSCYVHGVYQDGVFDWWMNAPM